MLLLGAIITRQEQQHQQHPGLVLWYHTHQHTHSDTHTGCVHTDPPHSPSTPNHLSSE